MPIIYICPQGDFQYAPGDEYQRRVEQLATGYRVIVGPASPDKTLLNDIEIFYGSPSYDDLKKMTALRWLHLQSAGVDRYTDKALYANPECILTGSSGVYGLPIAEHILAMFFALMRSLQLYRDDRQTHAWIKRMPATDFEGSTVGIIGLGDIGGTLAKKCHALGARVLAVKNTVSQKPEYVDELYTSQAIDQVLPRCDFVALCLPNTPATTSILSRRRIDSLKSNAVIVNIGRGTAIDQDALIDALRDRRIGGAGLDVTVPEPLPADNELWRLDNCLITAHDSGRSLSNKQRSFDIFADNLAAFIKGTKMRNVVDFVKGY